MPRNRITHLSASHRKLITVTLLITLWLVANLALAADQLINRISIEGNKKTKDAIILQELTFEPQTTVDDATLEQSRQAIMDLGLFESVQASVGPDTLGSPSDLVLTITVVEKKHDWYVLPRINRNGDGDITLGVDLRINNLHGKNQKSNFTLAHKSYQESSLDEEVRLNWTYVDPRIAGTRFSAALKTILLNVGVDEERGDRQGLFDRDQLYIEGRLGKWFSDSGQSSGLRVELGLGYSYFNHKYISGDQDLLFDANVVTAIGRVEYTKVHDYLFSREGFSVGFELENANKDLGSDVSYTHQSAFYRRYIALGANKHTNLNIQVLAGSGDRSTFGDPIYDFSGDRTIRGIPRETLEGDAFFLVNTEYLRPLFGKEELRGGAILDFGNTYDNIGDISDLDFEFGAGMTLRWKLKSWVNTEIRIDAARGFGDYGENKVYFSTRAFF